MKLKGLAKLEVALSTMQNDLCNKIDDLDQEGSQWEEKDTFLNDAYMELDDALEAVKRVAKMKLEDYL